MCYARRQRSSWARIKLSKKLYINWSPRWNQLIRVIFLLNYFYIRALDVAFRQIVIIQKNFRSLLYFSFFSLYTWLLFNFQWAFFVIASGFQLRELFAISLFIISHSLSFVKGFCKTFFKFFRRGFSFKLLCRSSSTFHRSSFFSQPPCLAQPVYYITSACVCQEVFGNFLKFFHRLAWLTCVSQTAYIVYHIVRLLSTPFDKVFEIFLKKPMGTATKSISYAECRAGWPTLGILIALGWRHPAVERISIYGMGVGIHHPTVE